MYAVRYQEIWKAVTSACERVGRHASEVTIVGVTKTVSTEAVIAAHRVGITTFGENRVQEAAPKIAALQAADLNAQWHLIGHLQTNKAKKAIELFDVIQSVDSVRLAEQLQRHAEALSRRVEIFAQVNTSGEGTKSGVTPAEAIHLARELANFPNLWLRGFMTIGAFVNDHEVIRTGFRTLRQLAVEVAALNLPGVKMSHLSMGMTNDFVIAIEEGSTMVRIGRAIFGERN